MPRQTNNTVTLVIVILTLSSLVSGSAIDSSVGSGIFGDWIFNSTDRTLCYSYKLNQYRDERAKWSNTLNEDRRTHWYNIGNSRINILCSNDGLIQLYLSDRGGTIVNKFGALDFELKPDQRDKGNYQPHAYSGGYAYLVDQSSNHIWSNAYRYFNQDILDNPTSYSRLFCSVYFNTTLLYNDIEINHSLCC